MPAHRLTGPTTPTWQRRRAITPCRFGLFPLRSPLLGESRLLSIPRGTEMFQFPRLPQLALCVQTRVTGHDPSRVSPFGHPRVKARLAAHRGLSQPAASFIGSQRLGIHRQPFVAWVVSNTSTFCRARYAVLKKPRTDFVRSVRVAPQLAQTVSNGPRDTPYGESREKVGPDCHWQSGPDSLTTKQRVRRFRSCARPVRFRPEGRSLLVVRTTRTPSNQHIH